MKSNLIAESRIQSIRHFNRFMTRHIGALREGLLHSPFSLTESRILFEIATRKSSTASDLSKELGLDTGYLSRILNSLEYQKLIMKVRSEIDGRQRNLILTSEGEKVFELINKRSNDEINELLSDLTEQEQIQLINSMKTIEELLGKNKGLRYSEPYFLRQHEPGDMGMIVHKHGKFYAEEYNWNESFEALVSKIVSDFINQFNPKRERCWIAEMNGEVVGSVFLVEENKEISKLRLLLVDPKARDLGLGTKLVEECIRFAKRVGYKKITLWTNSILKEARHIYQKTGFELVLEEKHHSFGHDLVGETWEKTLS